MAEWYAVQTTTGAEQDVRMRLSRMAYPAMLPMKVMRERRGGKAFDVTRAMLPGYVFVETGMRAADWHCIRHLPGVLRILGGEQPAPLTRDEAERIAWLDNGGTPWAISTARATPKGVVITGGPLALFEKEIETIDRRQGRARIHASVLGEEKRIDLALIFEEEKQSEEPEG